MDDLLKVLTVFGVIIAVIGIITTSVVTLYAGVIIALVFYGVKKFIDAGI